MKSRYIHFGTPYLSISNYELNQEIVNIIPEETARYFKIIGIDLFDKIFTIGMVNPDDDVINVLESQTGYKIIPFKIDIYEWVNVINNHYSKTEVIVK